MFESLKKPKFEPKKLTIGDITDTGFVVDFSKLNKQVKKCIEDKENKICKLELEKMGISWIED